MIDFRVDQASGVPPYLQLARQVRHAVRFALVVPGDQLPTVREVVAAVAINPNTVLKAYRELEREGLIASRPGLGTFVLTSLPGPSPRTVVALRRSLDRWVTQARTEGLDAEAIVSFVDDALAQGAVEHTG
ncbi:MAG: GntR family transcriptional regulator [Actinomycetota bacterium]|nr:GntR family transcriptional regulator [Actinomycetota bacterium]